MVTLSGKGSQKLARQRRLVNEIYNFVTANPGVNSAAISGYLTAELKLKNAGLTSRKIGYFIPRYCKKQVRFEEQSEGRTYFPIEENNNLNKDDNLEKILDD
jgi:hypothetical protein